MRTVLVLIITELEEIRQRMNKRIGDELKQKNIASNI